MTTSLRKYAFLVLLIRQRSACRIAIFIPITLSWRRLAFIFVKSIGTKESKPCASSLSTPLGWNSGCRCCGCGCGYGSKGTNSLKPRPICCWCSCCYWWKVGCELWCVSKGIDWSNSMKLTCFSKREISWLCWTKSSMFDPRKCSNWLNFFLFPSSAALNYCGDAYFVCPYSTITRSFDAWGEGKNVCDQVFLPTNNLLPLRAGLDSVRLRTI